MAETTFKFPKLDLEALFAFQNGFFWQTVLKRNPPTPGKPA